MLYSILNHKYYVAIALNLCMLCVAWINWHGVTQIFETPENHKSYTWLKAVKQEPKLKTFKQSELPKGTVLKAEQLYAISQDLAKAPEQIRIINTYLKHHYLTNYETLNSVNYLSGSYRIIKVQPLTKDNWVTQGLAVDVQAIELIHDELSSSWVTYPFQATLLLPHITSSEFQLKVGSDIELRSAQALSIIHLDIPVVADNPNLVDVVTSSFIPKVIAVPLGQHLNLTGHSKLLSIKPAAELNIGALALPMH